MKIGVISDTHNFFDPQIPRLLKGVDHILHGGDVGLPWIISELEKIAPVTAVLGNTDRGMTYKETEVVELAGRKFLVHHIVDALRPSAVFKQCIEREHPEVVIFGHTHKPFNEIIGETLYFNPGYAGKQRFSLPRSLAILHCTPKKIRRQYFDL